jgi:hypothetical protein
METYVILSTITGSTRNMDLDNTDMSMIRKILGK